MNRFNQIFCALLLASLITQAQPAVTLTPVFSFQTGGTIGYRSLGGLIEGSDGNLYGTTWGGGAYGGGTVFQLTPQGQCTVIHDFGVNANEGDSPTSSLVQGNDGYLYGVSPNAPGGGAIFRVGLDGSYTNLFLFPFPSPPGNPFGYWPNGLILGSDGNFYGTTQLPLSGASLFQVTPSGVGTALWTATSPGPLKGDAITQGSDGKLYGLIPGTSSNTASVAGLIYSMSCTPGTPNIVGSFDPSGGTNGVEPNSIIQGADGNFYGTANYGGPWPHAEPHYWGYGTVFKMTPDGVISSLHAFSGDDGFYPYSLMQATDGNLYGATPGGGTNGGGTLFQISPSGQFRLLYSFSSSDLTIGNSPLCVLLQARDGNFYGTTSQGGGGAVFKLSVPLADSPSIQSLSLSNGVFTLNWLALRGRSYQVQFTSDLTSTGWSNLGGPVLATNHLASLPDLVGSNTQRYYRVALLP